MISITEHPDGCVLPVRAQPGARKTGVRGEQAGMVKAAVTAPQQDGKANRALLETLREVLGLKRSQVALFSGETSREKRFLICGVTKAELEERIAALERG